MIKPLPTAFEAARLAALNSYGVLDTPTEKDLDELAELAAKLCGVPIAFISFVDDRRQWFKAAFGTKLKETDRDISFCAHAIHQPDVFIVPDTTKDERFADNPLVVGEPGIRFYAGATLVTSDGQPLGTLCVLDRKPHELTADQTHTLQLLSRHVMAQLGLRRQANQMSHTNGSLLGILEDELMAESALRESEALNRGVLDSMLAHIAVLDRDGKIIAVNDAWRQFARENAGPQSASLARTDVGTNYLEMCRASQGVFSAEAMLAHDGLLAVLRGEKTHFMLEYPCHSERRQRWFLLSVTPLKTKNGGAAVSHLEISERKCAEEELRAKTAFLEAQVHSALDGLLVVNNQGKIILRNQRLIDLWKIPAAIIESNDDAQQLRYIAHRVENRDQFIAKVEYLNAHPDEISRDEITLLDGTILDRYSAPVQDKAKKNYGRIWTFRDLTQRRKLEEQFRHAQKMEAVGQLAGGVAHDFNNILAVVQMQSDLVKFDGNLSREQLECMDEITVAAQRATNLTRQLLLFSRHEHIKPIDLDLGVSISSMAKMLRRLLGEHIQMQIKFAPQSMLIHADAGMLDQILMNLAVNSRDAMPRGGSLTIETAAVEMDELAASQSPRARPGSFVCLSVSDTGTGISAEILPRIFEPFFTTKDVGKGSGLGLATVFGIVEQHHGWVDVRSVIGQGTTFRIYFPRLAEMSLRPQNKQATLSTIRGGSETILLLEDDLPLRAAFMKALAQLGYHILEAGTAAEAFEVWEKHRDTIDLLLTDIVIPGGVTGKEFAELLLQSAPKLKVIYMSGYTPDNTFLTAEQAHGQGIHFLPKPFDALIIAQAVRAALEKD